ncbi:MAG: TIGR02147 family protein, partial [Bdellovibrio sp.]|nr:TIGR02147 family protein [Bdellovibrio sp.]
MKLFEFLDPYLVLQSYYQDRKDREVGFSYSRWADELGLKSSSTLRMMVHGKKRISPRLAEVFAEKNLQTDDERKYFSLLLAYVHAPSLHAKNSAWSSLSRILTNKIDQQEAANYFVYVSDILIPKITTMLSFDDHMWSESNLCETLGVEAKKLSEVLAKLQDNGFVECLEDQGQRHWKAVHNRVMVPDKLGDLALRAYHNACMDEAKEAQNLPVHSRKYRSMLVPLSEQEYQEFSEEMNTFAKKILARYQSDKYQD